jgi:regulation of enolase protein 1 (concanavalin A-like superfamily)
VKDKINECTDIFRQTYVLTDLNHFIPKFIGNVNEINLESKVKSDLIAFVADEVFFIHKKLNADGFLIAKIENLESNENSRAGLMIRDSNQGAGKMFQCSITYSKNPTIISRSIGSATKSISQYPVTNFSWIKLERINNGHSCYFSDDALVWNKYGTSKFITFSGDIFVGLYQNGANASSIGKATFKNITYSGFNGICSNRGSCNPLSQCNCPVGFTGDQCQTSILQQTATLLCNTSCNLNLTEWSLCNEVTGPNCYCNQTSTIQTPKTNIKCSNDSEITEL